MLSNFQDTVIRKIGKKVEKQNQRLSLCLVPLLILLHCILIQCSPECSTCSHQSKGYGMKYANICMDMQLYIVACQIKWSDTERWKDVILHPGMMHALMSFVGCIGTLLKSSGLEVLLSPTFVCIKSILSGKAWPQALRAYRMITGALLHNFIAEEPCTYDDIQTYLSDSSNHPTGKLWVDCLIRPTLTAHQFLHAERKGDMLLRDYCLNEMLPYFFAAGHFHYA